ncbi:hypothetical protein HZF07_20940 [Nocardioides sp. CGMCC 1.13656]|nr:MULTISPECIES: hypothetical protein [unclassified Nocardioides]MBA2956201.1 hypothetical protein [Nocardioides sp. CGMCC 1.13656]
MNPTHDLPSRRQLDEAWRRVAAALHTRHRPTRRPLTWLAVSEERSCSRD